MELEEIMQNLNWKERIITKVFTKNNGRDIIKNKHNLLNKNNDFYEREGLSMKKTKDVILNEVIKELSYVEKFVVKIFSKTFIKVYKFGITYGFNNK